MPYRTKRKVIQGVIFKAFDVETLGRELKRMDNACKEQNIGWDYCKYNFGFSFIFKRKKLGNNAKYENISLDAKRLLSYMKESKGILENSSIAIGVLNKKDRVTHKVIKELVDNNIIERIGSNKSGYWKIIC